MLNQSLPDPCSTTPPGLEATAAAIRAMTQDDGRAVQALQTAGYAVLRAVHDASTVVAARGLIIREREHLRNTRPSVSAGHLAGFHRHPNLEPLHALVSCHPRILSVLRNAVGGSGVRTIGLSDITMNRSQGWHVDLLRGPYQRHLDQELIWSSGQGVLFKVLLYLQDSSSLSIERGSHLRRRPLHSDADSLPAATADIDAPVVRAGDVILMDLRMSHRGSNEEAFQGAVAAIHSKLLVTTVLGAIDSPLTSQMELGNCMRQLDWDRRHQRALTPLLAGCHDPTTTDMPAG